MNLTKNKFIRIIAVFTIVCVMFQTNARLFTVNAEGEKASIDNTAYEDYISNIELNNSSMKYSEYQIQNKDKPVGEEKYIISAKDYTSLSDMKVETFENYEGDKGTSILTQEQGAIEWEINIKKAGRYNLSVLYYPIEGKGTSIQRSVLIDGVLPFSEAGTVEFKRYWANETDEVSVDSLGNDIRRRQIEKPIWSTEFVKDARGYNAGPFEFYFSEGIHTISFISQREPLLIKEIALTKPESIPSYEELYKEYTSKGYVKTSGDVQTIQAEDAVYKSSPMLYGISDHSSPAVTPYDAAKVKINTIGGGSWKDVGDWLEWEIDVPETGLYRLGFNVKQSFAVGVPVKRKLTIDGIVPFTEMEQIDFLYHSSWKVAELGGKEPYLFYLEAGRHTLRLEAVLGDLSSYVSEVESVLRRLNEIYRAIIMITGTAPDAYRDYQLEAKVPNLSKDLAEQSKKLKIVLDGMKEVSGKSSDKEAILNTMVHQLNTLSGDVEKIIPKLGDFKSNIGGLAAWLIQINEVPLQLDALYLIPAESETPKTNNSFFAKVLHEIKCLYYSFIVDYNSIGSVNDTKSDRNITVWVGSGRDQANVLKLLIDETFTKDTGINVNLMLVPTDTLLQAALSGQGPDVAMQVANNIPMNYAMRGAVSDLTQFNDFGKITERFNDSALIPYQFDGKCYALPETQTFPMLFYRKDILKEQGLDAPETWDDFKATISTLNRNNMTVGLLPLNQMIVGPFGQGLNTDAIPMISYGIFLYQMGGEFYTKDAKASALNSEIAINAFKEWTKYYSDYTLDREYDFASRFRTGEMPIGIADFSMYNTLQVSAPEIQGLWDFTQVPGTVKEDGSVDHTVPSSGLAVILLEQSKDKEAAWEYMKWWTSKDTQLKFGREMESIIGPAGRYLTANLEALEMLPLPVKDYNNIKLQFANVKGIPEVPGGYFTGRNITNAFYKVVISQSIGPREALMDNVRFINDEIANKREEFGLEK